MRKGPVFYTRKDLPPATNAERQADFRKRHPDYYRLLHAKRRARTKAHLVAWQAENFRKEQEALAAQAASISPQEIASTEIIATQQVPIASQQKTPASPVINVPIEPTPAIDVPTPSPFEPADDDWNADLIALTRLHVLRREAEALIGTPR